MSKTKEDTRKKFRDACFSRDKHACVMCGVKESLTVRLNAHHISNRKGMPNGGYVKENGVTLCDIEAVGQQTSCHQKAESWWTDSTLQESGHVGFDPETLYQKIGSTYAKAVEASKKL